MDAFDNRFVTALPGDPETANHPRPVHGAAWSPVRPTPVREPRLVALSPEVCALLGLDPEEVARPEWVEVLTGNRLFPGMEPYAAAYGGHQFGHWAGQLGDGRAINLGERVAPDGSRWEMQLKGAGPTPYSRGADGRAVLRSSVREFLASEAMHHLGVPTTRALSLTTTGEGVLRDLLYDGNARYEPGAVVCRVAPSFLRFGNLQLPASRGDEALLRTLLGHVLEEHYPELGPVGAESALALLREVGRRTVSLVAHWQRVGFVHGVLNTDNLSLLGLTLDYGPFGWLEPFDPTWTPNTTDAAHRRYAYGNQPRVVLWNLARLAEALYPVVGEVPPLEEAMVALSDQLEQELLGMWRSKLGLREVRAEDASLVDGLLGLLHRTRLDLTLTFRALARLPSEGDRLAPLRDAAYRPLTDEDEAALLAWLERYAIRARDEGLTDAERRARMDAVNPLYVLRNYLVFQAIEQAEAGDASGVHTLLDVLRRPYEEQPGREAFAAKRPDWAADKPGCSMLSCSS